MGHWDTADWRAEDLVGGHVVLDFVNTAGGRTKARDVERLGAYADLLRWSVAAGVLGAEEAAALGTTDSTRHEAGAAVLDRAVVWREALHAVLMAQQAGEPLPETALGDVEIAIRASLLEARLSPEAAGLSWRAEPAEPLALPLARLCLAAQDLLTSEALARVRNCERCSWLFLDRGRGRGRRWCSMAACGNRAKAARHHARAKRQK